MRRAIVSKTGPVNPELPPRQAHSRAAAGRHEPTCVPINEWSLTTLKEKEARALERARLIEAGPAAGFVIFGRLGASGTITGSVSF